MSELAGHNGNVIFLVCKPCHAAGERDHGVKIAGRTQRSFYASMVPNKQLDNWLAQHARCGGRTNPDHFTIAYLQPHNEDQDELQAAVKTALVVQ